MEPLQRVRSRTVVINVQATSTPIKSFRRVFSRRRRRKAGRQAFADWRYLADGSPNPTSC